MSLFKMQPLTFSVSLVLAPLVNKFYDYKPCIKSRLCFHLKSKSYCLSLCTNLPPALPHKYEPKSCYYVANSAETSWGRNGSAPNRPAPKRRGRIVRAEMAAPKRPASLSKLSLTALREVFAYMPTPSPLRFLRSLRNSV